MFKKTRISAKANSALPTFNVFGKIYIYGNSRPRRTAWRIHRGL